LTQLEQSTQLVWSLDSLFKKIKGLLEGSEFRSFLIREEAKSLEEGDDKSPKCSSALHFQSREAWSCLSNGAAPKMLPTDFQNCQVLIADIEVKLEPPPGEVVGALSSTKEEAAFAVHKPGNVITSLWGDLVDVDNLVHESLSC
jgi:hypothetical protein